MRKTSIVLMTGLLLCFFSAQATIKESSNYFIGSWKVIVIGTPNGDATLIVHLVQKEGKLSGYIDTDDQSIPTIPISKVEEQNNSVIIYYSASGYDVYMSMVKIDNNNVEGKLMGMFELSGERVLEK